MYLPSVGFFLAVSSLAFCFANGSGVAPWCSAGSLPALFAAAAGLAVVAHQRNELWRDPVALWEDVVRKSPDRAA